MDDYSKLHFVFRLYLYRTDLHSFLMINEAVATSQCHKTSLALQSCSFEKMFNEVTKTDSGWGIGGWFDSFNLIRFNSFKNTYFSNF